MVLPPPDKILTLLKSSPSIPHFLPSSPRFLELLDNYTSNPARPSVILRPHTEHDVAAIVACCASASAPFTVRSGGHDLCGRSIVQDTVCIDMRDINHVKVGEDKSTAKIGGGVLLAKLVSDLEAEGLMTAVGTIGTVGFVGWSTFGGYGPYLPKLGLGLDQIVGAKVASATGVVEEADEALLKGIRGGAGNFGVIVEPTVKVYPVQEVQNGMLIYDSSNIANTTTMFFNALNAVLARDPLPDSLCVQPCVINIPGHGKTLMVSYVWNGPSTMEEEEWRRKISACGPILASTVNPSRPAEMINEITALVPPRIHLGRAHTVSLSPLTLSASAIAKIVEFAEAVPGDSVGFWMHQFHGRGSTPPFLPSVFLNRQEHWMLEIMGLSGSSTGAEASSKWADEFVKAMRGVEGVQAGTYLPLTWKEDVDLEKMYSEDGVEVLKRLKKERDPGNLFKHALPVL